jgi:hypothetical protein
LQQEKFMNTGLNDEATQVHLKQLAEQCFRNLRLKRGGHKTSVEGLCLMEAVAFFAGEPDSEYPQCTSPVLAEIGRRLNDLLSDEERQLLIPLIPRLLDTRSTTEHDSGRACLMIDLTIREIVPMGLHAVGWTDLADQLRSIGPIIDPASAAAASEVVQAVQEEAFTRASASYASYASYASDGSSDASDASYASASAAYAAYAAAASAAYAASAAAAAAAEYASASASAAASASYASASASSAAAVAHRSIIEATVRAYEQCILLPA